MPSVSEQAAQWSARLEFSAVPADIVAATRGRILDTIGVVLAVAGQDYGRKIRGGSLAMGGKGAAHILGFADQTAPQAAAIANGAMASALSYDDTHNATIVHVTATLLAAALALGEELDASGEDFLTALIAGSELACRIGMAAPLEFHKRGWHPTGLFGAFGATYAACRLLGLDALATVQAVGIAGSFAAGIGQGMREGVEFPISTPAGPRKPGLLRRCSPDTGITVRSRCSRAGRASSAPMSRTPITASISPRRPRGWASAGNAAGYRSSPTLALMCCIPFWTRFSLSMPRGSGRPRSGASCARSPTT